MLKFLTRRSNAHWIVIFTLLFAALAPGMSQAFVRSSSTSQLIAICTSTGMKYVKAPSAATGSELESSSDGTECSYCQTIQHLLVLDQIPLLKWGKLSEHFPLFTVLSPGRTRLEWRLPPPRAPPELFS